MGWRVVDVHMGVLLQEGSDPTGLVRTQVVGKQRIRYSMATVPPSRALRSTPDTSSN